MSQLNTLNKKLIVFSLTKKVWPTGQRLLEPLVNSSIQTPMNALAVQHFFDQELFRETFKKMLTSSRHFIQI